LQTEGQADPLLIASHAEVTMQLKHCCSCASCWAGSLEEPELKLKLKLSDVDDEVAGADDEVVGADDEEEHEPNEPLELEHPAEL
jgi:hypothetical protein